jgi:hypothetical protein
MAMLFDGVDQYVSVADMGGILGTTFSVSFWIKTTQAPVSANFYEWPGVTGFENAGDGNDMLTGTISNTNKIGVNVGDSGRVESTSNVNDGNWHQVVITRNHTTGLAEVYFDGVLEGSATRDTGTKTTVMTVIGRVDDSGGTPEELAGTLDDFRLYDRALTAVEVQTIHACRGTDAILQGLRRRYLFDGGAPGVAASGAGSIKDIAIDRADGTPNGTTSPVYQESPLRSRRRLVA